MTIRTLGLAILTSVATAVCSFGAVDRGLLALVPPNSQYVAGIDVVASRESDFGQYLNTRFSTEMKGLEQFTAETGFDPRRDLQSVLVAGGSPQGSRTRNGIVLARGIFDESKIRSAALGRGAVVQNFSGVDLYVVGEGLHQNAFAFLGGDVFATGPAEQLQQAVANRVAPAKLNAQLQKLISQAGANNDIWFATIAPASRLPMHFGPETDQSVADSQTLQAISSASGGVRLGSSVEITLDAVARSDKDASALADVLRFGASLLRANGASDAHSAALASILNQMLVTATGPNVHLTVSMPEATLEQLAEVRPQHHRRAH
jgi:hypothetical protein